MTFVANPSGGPVSIAEYVGAVVIVLFAALILVLGFMTLVEIAVEVGHRLRKKD